jgi:hypothetical protein
MLHAFAEIPVWNMGILSQAPNPARSSPGKIGLNCFREYLGPGANTSRLLAANFSLGEYYLA